MGQPADAPAGHRPGLGEAVDREHAVAVLGDLQDRGRDVAVEIEPVVDLVGDDPDAGAAAEVEQRLQLLRARRPAGRVGRRRQEDGARAGIAGGEQRVEVEPPVGVEVERDGTRLAADQVDGVVDVRPLRRDIDDVGAEYRPDSSSAK